MKQNDAVNFRRNIREDRCNEWVLILVMYRDSHLLVAGPWENSISMTGNLHFTDMFVGQLNLRERVRPIAGTFREANESLGKLGPNHCRTKRNDFPIS